MNTILVAVATAELLLNSADEKRKSTGGVGRTGHFLVFTDTKWIWRHCNVIIVHRVNKKDLISYAAFMRRTLPTV